MLVGGTGITPMIQALHAVLGTEGDDTKVTMLYGSKTQKDILCRDLLDKWEADSNGRLKVVHVLSESSNDASWGGSTGFIDKQLIQSHCAAPQELTGVLSDMGFSASQV